MSAMRWLGCAALVAAHVVLGCAAETTSTNGASAESSGTAARSVSTPADVAAPTGTGGTGASSNGGTGMPAAAPSSFSNSAEGIPASSPPPPVPAMVAPGAVPAAMDAASAGSASTASNGGGDGGVSAGTLTAGAWDDNRNFDRFKRYRSDLLQQGLSGVLPTTDDEHQQAYELFSQAPAARQTLDVALVIDTTGSMGDEMAYLQAEFLAIADTIESRYPNAQQRWALVVYRDTSDDYVVRSFDFDSDTTHFQQDLADQVAAGGGDFPEAPDAALAEMSTLGWRSDSDTARLAFWVADAPHHADKASAMADAVRAARDLGVHVYPVASSGVDELTELTMRSTAQLTGGRYLFLTDDSGVGGAHKEPSIPCYFVTRLNDAIVRMVDIELSGQYHEPDADQVIRTGGDPQDGACQLGSGELAQVF